MLHLTAEPQLPHLKPLLGVLVREAGDLLSRASLVHIVFFAVYSQAGLVILKDAASAAHVLFQLTSIVPELGEIAPQGQVVEWQLYCGMRITSKARGRYFLGGQATADLMTPLKYANAHASIFLQVHCNEQRLVSTTNYYCIKGLVGHTNLLYLHHFYIHILYTLFVGVLLEFNDTFNCLTFFQRLKGFIDLVQVIALGNELIDGELPCHE